jgi:hypothetical protein
MHGRNGPAAPPPQPWQSTKKFATPTGTLTEHRERGIFPVAPAYYLGRPAHMWFEAMLRSRSSTSISATLATPPASCDRRTVEPAEYASAAHGWPTGRPAPPMKSTCRKRT